MAVSALYMLHSVTLASPAAGFTQIRNATINNEPAVRVVYNSGAAYPTMVVADGAAPVIRFTTTELYTLLDVCSNGDDISVNTSGGNVVLTLQKVSEFGTRSGSADSLTFTLADSMLFWESITAPNGGLASADVVITAAFDGTNAPIAYSTTTAGYTGAASEQFKLGPVEFNGTAVTGVQRVRIGSGCRLMAANDQSNPYPDFLAVAREAPSASIEVSSITNWNTVPFTSTSFGAALSTNGLEVFFRRMTNQGTFVANATASHILAQMTTGLLYPDALNVPDDDRAVLSLMAQGIGSTDATNPLAITTGTAIS